MSKLAFRHETGARLALTSGHVTHVGHEWTELDPMFHQEALVQGCEVNKNFVGRREEVVPQSSPEAVKNFDEDTLIREALELIMARDEPGDITSAQLPNVNIVSKLAGIKADKEAVYRIWRDLNPSAVPPADPAAV